MSLPDSSILTNIHVPGPCRPLDALFEKKYITTRSLENRLYSDEEVMKLPQIAHSHTHYKEWQMRRRSARRLIGYLKGKRRPLEVLEIGCGNGWLSHHIAEIPDTQVTGLDINFTELQQAARVFNDDPNLAFIHGDLRSPGLGGRQFDIILFAATMEYFPSLKKIVHRSLMYLKPEGEMHIMDTRFYRQSEIPTARMRTLAYYTSLGYPEMADYYFHHSSRDLRSFHHVVLHNPNSFAARLLRGRADLPWIRITN
ncbi:MAG: class I SAM-dependent methyltransferase [Chitinophagaceae bacterium]|nr:class I SAM-dependent methyltransferase [Chitinophagaceae bacterium]